MLVEKNQPSKMKKKANKLNKRNRKSLDLLLYEDSLLEISNKPIKFNKQIDHNDILNLFKSLEGYILRGKYNFNLEELKLGKFIFQAERLYDNLPKLLVSIYSLNSLDKKNFITLLFSSIRIYRNFKTKSQINIKSITDPYKGQDLNLILKEEFSSAEIDK
jgi:hypothetical protein